MAVQVNVTTNGLGTYRVFQGETEHPGESGWKNCAEVHFYPNVGASINARYILETSYKNNNTGRTNYYRYEGITWNGQVWMHQDDWGKECRLMSQQGFGAADYISECKMSLTCLGEGNN